MGIGFLFASLTQPANGSRAGPPATRVYARPLVGYYSAVSRPVSFILNYNRTNLYAFNVLVGAIESAEDCDDVEIVFAESPDNAAMAARDALAAERVALVGWSFYSPQYEKIYAELNAVKSSCPGAIHLAGGVHATAEPEHTLRAGFDFAALGEGEKTIIDVLRRLKAGQNLRGTPGLSYLDSRAPFLVLKQGALPVPHGGKYVSNGQGERIDLDDFPPCAVKHCKFNPIEITRGCIYACKFCQTPFMFKARFRHRSVENVCKYVRIVKNHKDTDVRFITPTAFSYGSQDESVNLEKIEELLASVREALGKRGRVFFGTFPSEVRPEHVTAEGLKMIKRYIDNDNLIIGGQSGSERILAASKRGHDTESIERAARIAIECGFKPNIDFIFGLPGETAQDVTDSLRLAEKLSDLGARIHAHTFMPLPGTPYKNEAPGKLDADTSRQLELLASSGRLYGQWKGQEEHSASLAKIGRKRA